MSLTRGGGGGLLEQRKACCQLPFGSTTANLGRNNTANDPSHKALPRFCRIPVSITPACFNSMFHTLALSCRAVPRRLPLPWVVASGLERFPLLRSLQEMGLSWCCSMTEMDSSQRNKSESVEDQEDMGQAFLQTSFSPLCMCPVRVLTSAGVLLLLAPRAEMCLTIVAALRCF